MLTLKTGQVVKLLGCMPWQLHRLVEARKVTPQKDGSGHRVWTQADVEAARQHLERRKRM